MTALIEQYRTDHATLVKYVCGLVGIGADQATASAEQVRRKRMAQRVRLYRDDSEQDIGAAIDMVFETKSVREERRKMIAVASEQNITRLIIDQIASLYDRPARRALAAAGEVERFRVAEKRVALHEIMQEAHRLTVLCNEVMIWQYEGLDGKRLRVVTPDMFTAIASPQDHCAMAGVLIDASPLTILDGEAKKRLPHFELWDDKFRYLINAAGHLVTLDGEPAAVPIEHGLDRIPAVLLHRREPTERLMEDRHGRDITSAHLGCAVLQVMIMRLSKSQGERQPILQGNLANVLRGQTMNGEGPIILPPEVTASILDTQTNPDHYLAVKRDKLASVAASYGMSYEFLTNGDDGSGASGRSYEVRREKLTELRLEQRRRAVVHEAQVVELMGFAAEGMRVDYQEQAIPQDAAEKIALLKDKMHLGLDSPVDYLMREDPDLDRAAAIKRIDSNLGDWSRLVRKVRALNMPADADAANPGNTPQQNGAIRTGDANADGTNQPASGDPTQDPAMGTATAA